ncbi:hypothetical protein GLYMA_05G174500v4 [Glycine max]|uniref:Uncharacterized protein n=1 Tax=Glycine max TaxID=3847 RepID=K7KQU6_SOYBN|nr:hypothetical protein GYH30_012971 [Glycine max]KRH59259.1 hypothetical protein GLYMA_05G174500v4 [Glycine max]
MCELTCWLWLTGCFSGCTLLLNPVLGLLSFSVICLGLVVVVPVLDTISSVNRSIGLWYCMEAMYQFQYIGIFLSFSSSLPEPYIFNT